MEKNLHNLIEDIKLGKQCVLLMGINVNLGVSPRCP